MYTGETIFYAFALFAKIKPVRYLYTPHVTPTTVNYAKFVGALIDFPRRLSHTPKQLTLGRPPPVPPP